MEARAQEEMLNKRLAEWAGFKVEWFKSGGDFYATYPDGGKDTIPNFIQSLDACFKWLAPKLLSAHKFTMVMLSNWGEDWWQADIGATIQVRDKSPAPALCLAIEKLIDKEV